MSVGDRETRRDRSQDLQRRFAAMSDLEVVELVIEGEVLGAGIGGTRSLVVLDDIPLFVKRVPLTDLERLPANVGSTANLFDLPSGCNYGVGSPSFGVWREVAANSMTTSWVASGSCGSFPMLHHWRALTIPAFEGPLPDELGDIEALVAHWHGSPAVRRRVEAIADSSAAVGLFFEYIPRLLSEGVQQIDVGANFGSCFGANRNEVALPLPATLPPQVERLVSDRSHQIPVKMLDLGPRVSARCPHECARHDVVSVVRTHDRCRKPQHRRGVRTPRILQLPLLDTEATSWLIREIHLNVTTPPGRCAARSCSQKTRSNAPRVRRPLGRHDPPNDFSLRWLARGGLRT